MHRLKSWLPGDVAVGTHLARLSPLIRDLEKFVAWVRKISGKPDTCAKIKIALPYCVLLVSHLVGEIRASAVELDGNHARAHVDAGVRKRGGLHMERI